MAEQDDMPAWVKDLDFLTEPLEGNKAYFILQNAQRLRTYFEGRPGKISQLFSIYDRHPPDTALDPQSGVLYFIRTEEGLQVRPVWVVGCRGRRLLHLHQGGRALPVGVRTAAS
jgi:hypothetical protein